MSKPNKRWNKEQLLEYIAIKRKDYDDLVVAYNNVIRYGAELEKALDKACEELENYSSHSYPPEYIVKEDWKEWVMKDD